MAPDTRQPSRTRRTVVIGSISAVIVGLVALAATWAPLRSQILLSVTRRPLPYAELYFRDFGSLPRFVYQGRTYEVPYTVVGHNERSSAMAVSGSVSYDGHQMALGRQTLRLDEAGRAGGSFEFSPPAPHTVYYVDVTLTGGQSIRWRVISP